MAKKKATKKKAQKKKKGKRTPPKGAGKSQKKAIKALEKARDAIDQLLEDLGGVGGSALCGGDSGGG